MAKFEYNVEMTCSGCSNAVTRVLTKLAGVDNFNVDLEQKRVTVESSSLSQQAVFDTISKTGKKTVLVNESA